MTDKVIQYRTRPDGPWQVALPGIYLNGRGQLTDSQRATAAFVYAGRALGITGPAAMRWHGLAVQPSELVDVLVPLRHSRRDAGFVRLLRTSVQPGSAYRDGAVSYVPLARAIADTARQSTDIGDVRSVVASAVQRGKVEIVQLMRELSEGPMQGSARLRLALAEVADGTRSAAEAEFRSIIRHFRLPTPLYNPRLLVGNQFLACPDAWWPDAGVAAEIDSRAWHLSPADYEQTLARHDRMTAHGILVLHFPPQRLRADARGIAKEIRSALAAARGPLPHLVTMPAG